MTKKKNKEKMQEWITKFKKVHKNKYDYSKAIYTGSNGKIEIICKKHGSFWQDPVSHGQGTGCPYCKKSHAENTIADYLLRKNIKFEREKVFPECKYKSYLRFDFYIPEKNMLIEYQGQQHYMPTRRRNSLEALKDLQTRDQIKRDFCLKKDIQLVEISYENEWRLEWILDRII